MHCYYPLFSFHCLNEIAKLGWYFFSIVFSSSILELFIKTLQIWISVKFLFKFQYFDFGPNEGFAVIKTFCLTISTKYFRLFLFSLNINICTWSKWSKVFRRGECAIFYNIILVVSWLWLNLGVSFNSRTIKLTIFYCKVINKNLYHWKWWEIVLLVIQVNCRCCYRCFINKRWENVHFVIIFEYSQCNY